MLKTANENKNTNIFLKDKILRGVTGYKQIRFIEGYINSEDCGCYSKTNTVLCKMSLMRKEE